MRKIGILGLVGVLALFLAGCGGSDGPDTTFIQSVSDRTADGDIGFTPPITYSFSNANTTGDVQYGFDSGTTEYNAFLDFPLSALPLNAVIVSADIEVFVNDVQFSSSVPTLLDLVPFSVPLTSADFNRGALRTRDIFYIRSLDIGRFVRIDVTSLMAEAQNQGLPSLQLRFVPASVAPGLVVLDDAVAGRRPLLTVEYW